MKKKAVKKKTIKKSASKELSESRFWQHLALSQQVLLHAKHHT